MLTLKTGFPTPNNLILMYQKPNLDVIVLFITRHSGTCTVDTRYRLGGGVSVLLNHESCVLVPCSKYWLTLVPTRSCLHQPDSDRSLTQRAPEDMGQTLHCLSLQPQMCYPIDRRSVNFESEGHWLQEDYKLPNEQTKVNHILKNEVIFHPQHSLSKSP